MIWDSVWLAPRHVHWHELTAAFHGTCFVAENIEDMIPRVYSVNISSSPGLAWAIIDLGVWIMLVTTMCGKIVASG